MKFVKHVFSIFLFLICIINPEPLIAQLVRIDSSVINEWKYLGISYFSPNGKYLAYTVENDPFKKIVREKQIIIKSINGRWQKGINYTASFNCVFSLNDKYCICNYDNKIEIISLGKSIKLDIDSVARLSVLNYGSETILCYIKSSNLHRLYLYNLDKNINKIIEQVFDYQCSSGGKNLIVKTFDEKKIPVLKYWDFKTNSSSIIYKGFDIGNLLWNPQEDKCAFQIKQPNTDSCLIGVFNRLDLSFHHFAFKNKFDPTDKINLIRFNGASDRLFISFIKTPAPKIAMKYISVDVWSYQDQTIQSRQAVKGEEIKAKYCVINLQSNELTKLTDGDENIITLGDLFLLSSKQLGDADRYESWNPYNSSDIYLTSVLTGKKTKLDHATNFLYQLSPGNKFVYYYNYTDQNLYSIETLNGIRRNITKNIKANWVHSVSETLSTKTASPTTTGWLKNDSGLLLNDNTDIWCIDPYGNKDPISITQNFGKNNNLVLRLINGGPNEVIDVQKEMYFSVYNELTKQNGFAVKSNYNISLLILNNSIIYVPDWGLGMKPLKAKLANKYIIRKETASSSSNYFYTTDFKNFKEISNVHPEKNVQWLSSELITWSDSQHHKFSGVLYKPENFDSTQQYPVIINYYDKKTQYLNKFRAPGYSSGEINIPWFIKEGYLVFTPDINFVIGKTGESALNTVNSSFDYLKQFNFIDSTKVGIQGTSFGGYLTDYIVSHSNHFAAAMSSVGISDLLNMYIGVNRESGVGNQEFVELSGLSMVDPIWHDPMRYIKASPIFFASQVQTPILLENNKDDAAVDFSQGVEFFLALRRLGKKVWLLQYDHQDHGLTGDAAKDYTIRMTQFFNHYLKMAQAPYWMTKGIKYKDKGVLTGLEYDRLIKTPDKGIVEDSTNKILNDANQR